MPVSPLGGAGFSSCSELLDGSQPDFWIGQEAPGHKTSKIATTLYGGDRWPTFSYVCVWPLLVLICTFSSCRTWSTFQGHLLIILRTFYATKTLWVHCVHRTPPQLLQNPVFLFLPLLLYPEQSANQHLVTTDKRAFSRALFKGSHQYNLLICFFYSIQPFWGSSRLCSKSVIIFMPSLSLGEFP